MILEIKRKRRADRLTVFYFPDIHHPNEDKKSLASAMNLCEDLSPDIIINLGDVLDCYSISRFDKDPTRVASLQEEFDAGRAHFEELRRRNPEARIIVKEGNHEERLQRYLWSQAPSLSSLRCLTVPEQLGLQNLGIEWVPAKQSFRLGSLIVTHGTTVRSKSGYTAHGEMMARQMSGISGHTHRLSSVWKTTCSGTLRWVEAGCLCDLNPEYGGDRALDWQQGVVVGHWLKSHDQDRLDLTIIPIRDHIAHYQGRLYTPDGVLTA